MYNCMLIFVCLGGIVGTCIPPPIMPSSHLACDRFTDGARILPVPPFLCGGLRAEAGGGCEIFVWIHGLCGLYDFL